MFVHIDSFAAGGSSCSRVCSEQGDPKATTQSGCVRRERSVERIERSDIMSGVSVGLVWR